MLKYLTQIFDLLSLREHSRAYMLLGMVLLMALLDMVGVASVMPFMAVLANPEVVDSNRYLAAAYSSLGFTDHGQFLFFLGIIVLIALVSAIAFKAITTYVLLRFTQMRNYSLSRRMVESYLRQPYEWFLHRHSADLGKAVLSEVAQVTNGAIVPLIHVIAYSAIVLSILVLLLLIDPVLTAITFSTFGIIYALTYLSLRRYLSRIGEARLEANRQRFQVVQEAFGGIKDVKVSGLEDTLLQRYDAPARRYSLSEAASQAASQLPRFALEAISFGGILGITLYLMAGPGGIQRALPILAVYALAGYRLIPAFQQIYGQLVRLRFAAPSVRALHADLVSVSASQEPGPPVPETNAMKLERLIELRHISYTYPSASRPALNNLTLEIPARTTVGLVGSTGSGKTTVADVVLGLLRPQQGQLVVDGTPVTGRNLRQWQRAIGYVPQQIFLADDSVAANIAFGVPDNEIDLCAVERAARTANLHDFIVSEMPEGYGTNVGERGIRLSGGQRQRIGIARSLYHDPSVLVLDEATSALDNLTEQAVMDAVHNLGHRKAIIIIAHRLTTVRECDQVFLLSGGCVVDHGTFSELVDKNKEFRAMAGNYG